MNAAARVIMNLSLRDHVKPALKQLHWLPVEQRIIYKLCLFMHHIHIGQAPKYLSDCVSTVSAASGRYRLRSTGSAAYVLPRTRTKFRERGFYSDPAAWNTLPSDLHDITDTCRFRKRLSNVLFDRAYNWLLLALLDESYSGALQISRWLIDWLIDCATCYCQNYFILSSFMDKTVRLWHISRRECLCCFQHIDFVTAIAFHPKVSQRLIMHGWFHCCVCSILLMNNADVLLRQQSVLLWSSIAHCFLELWARVDYSLHICCKLLEFSLEIFANHE